MPGRKSYHHGDLRSALLAAAEMELAEKGIEGFSLRGVAKRAGVSHAAPAHHFGDANGLLTALAARGFEQLMKRQLDFMEKAGPDSWEQLQAAGLGYVNFALEHTPIFRLMFSSDRPDTGDPELKDATEAAYAMLLDHLKTIHGALPEENPSVALDMAAAWATVHGLADILASGRLKPVSLLPEKARNIAIAAILQRSMPAGTGQA